MHELSRRKPHPPIPLSLQTTVEGGIQETTGEEHGPRTSPQPPPVRATARASTSRDSREHRHRKVTGKEATLHNLAPPGHLHAAVPSLSRPAGRCGGGARATGRDIGDPPAPTAPHEGRALRSGMRGGRGRRRRTQPGRARRGPGSPRCPPAASFQRAPRGSARDRSAEHLSRALPAWLYGIAS